MTIDQRTARPDEAFEQDELFLEPERPQAGNPDRFTRRWRLTGAGLSNVWRYGDLELDAPSGRLLLRGANGTGKTTALEALVPYLLDLNASRLAAGKARPTSLTSLMREGSDSKRRTGYGWLTFAAPTAAGDEPSETDVRSWGARLQYGPSSSPPVRVIAFTVPGRPLHDLALHHADREAIKLEDFTAAVTAAGGQVFDAHEDYVDDLAAHLWRGTAADVVALTARLREVRNPSLLGDVSPAAAADALRASLPTVSQEVITATADALAESDSTRQAFERDRVAAQVLADFAEIWTGHVVDVLGGAHGAATTAHGQSAEAAEALRRAATAEKAAAAQQSAKHRLHEEAKSKLSTAEARVRELETSDEYEHAERLNALRGALSSEEAVAQARLATLTMAATAAAGAGQSRRTELDDLRSDLQRLTKTLPGGPEAMSTPALPVWVERPHAVYLVGDTSVDPGPDLRVQTDPDELGELAGRWNQEAQRLTARAAAAAFAASDYRRTVETAQSAATDARRKATEAAARRDEAQLTARRRSETARERQEELLAGVIAWLPEHEDLCGHRSRGGEPTDGDADGVLDDSGPDGVAELLESAEELRTAEPAQVLTLLDAWSRRITATAGELAGLATAAAAQKRNDAQAHEAEGRARREQAAALRTGRLLPMPRPQWANPLDENEVAFGEALDWATGFHDAGARARLEVALADSGILGAALTAAAVDTSVWRVSPTGAAAQRNLTEAITVDEAHPHADLARAVLARITLATSADASDDPDWDQASLVVGLDGSFRAGALVGDRLAGVADRAAEAAAHVGARQRRAAALARADELDAEADGLEAEAMRCRTEATDRQAEANLLRQRGESFPVREALRAAEASRAAAAGAAETARSLAAEQLTAAEHAEAVADEAHRNWVDRCRLADLSPDLDDLGRLEKDCGDAAKPLSAAAGTVRATFVLKLRRIRTQVAAHHQAVQQLAELHGAAYRAQQALDATRERLRTQQDLAGDSADDVLAKVELARTERDNLVEAIPGLAASHIEAVRLAVACETEHSHASTEAARLETDAQTAAQRLRTLLATRGIVTALAASDTGTRIDPISATREELLEVAATLIAGRRTAARRTLQDRYDTARADLAGTWSLEYGYDDDELSTFVLTHNDEAFTPVTAAAHAQRLAQRAEAALHSAEDSALRDFIIGRLPAAVGVAWTRLLDWKRDVNTKMKSASASSGVGVQVEINPAHDMSPAVRTVYELSCRVADADRTDEQKTSVGNAIRALISAADGDSMTDKLAAAVDIRDWVDLWYVVERPGKEPKRWTGKTGLSGGERRLVVLAPMLAAVAAGYDGLDPAGLRLVALDEVPAEVDEAGREGLARYIAALDLDLVCTSYLWDGAPGAWDGIDAWDFEAAEEGTVVAFPMQVRGQQDLPGDYWAPGFDEPIVSEPQP